MEYMESMEFLDLRQYFQIARRWAWLLVLVLILGGVGGYLATQYQTPVYSSSATILISANPESLNNAYGYSADQ